MFRILLMPNMDKFLKLVERCYGDVILHLPFHTSCSLKTNDVARLLLKTLAHERDRLPDGIGISLSDKRDYPAVVRHMMEAECH